MGPAGALRKAEPYHEHKPHARKWLFRTGKAAALAVLNYLFR